MRLSYQLGSCIPVYSQGAENCLEGLTFVITGVLESMERSESQSLIERYGGKVTGSLSKRTSYVVVGRDAGESKMAKVNDPFSQARLNLQLFLRRINWAQNNWTKMDYWI